MATTIMPETPAADARPPADFRLSNIRANLMPDEVLIARRTEALRRQILLGLVVVVGLIIAWYAMSWWQTHSSNGDLDDANRRSVALSNQQHQYGDLVSAQNQRVTIATQLVKLTVGDVQWKPMLATLRSTAPKGIALTNVNANISSGAAVATGTNSSATPLPFSVLNQTGKPPIGSISIQGTAPDKKTIAAYVDKLAAVKGLTAPYPASVAVATNSTTTLTFTINAILTSDALGGRYSLASLGGK